MPCRPILKAYPKNSKSQKISKKSLIENPWMEWSKINNGLCCFCMEQEKIVSPSSGAHSKVSWETYPTTLRNKLNAINGNVIESHLKNNFHKQAHAAWRKNKGKNILIQSTLEFPVLTSQRATERLNSASFLKE